MLIKRKQTLTTSFSMRWASASCDSTSCCLEARLSTSKHKKKLVWLKKKHVYMNATVTRTYSHPVCSLLLLVPWQQEWVPEGPWEEGLFLCDGSFSPCSTWKKMMRRRNWNLQHPDIKVANYYLQISVTYFNCKNICVCVYTVALFSPQRLKPHFLPMLVVSNGTVYIFMNHLCLKKLKRDTESNLKRRVKLPVLSDLLIPNSNTNSQTTLLIPLRAIHVEQLYTDKKAETCKHTDKLDKALVAVLIF